MNDPTASEPKHVTGQRTILLIHHDAAGWPELQTLCARTALWLTAQPELTQTQRSDPSQLACFDAAIVALHAPDGSDDSPGEWAALLAHLPVIGWLDSDDPHTLAQAASTGIRDFLFSDSLTPPIIDHTLATALARRDNAAALPPGEPDSAGGLFHDPSLARMVFDAAQTPLVILDPTAHILWCNQMLQTLGGYTADELRGRAIFDLLTPAERLPAIRDAVRRVVEQGEEITGELGLIAQDGTEHSLHWLGRPYPGPDGSCQYVIGTAIDITRRRQVEMALRLSESRFRAMFMESLLGIALVDAEGNVVESNPAAQRMLGYSSEEMQQLTFDRYSDPEDSATDRELFAQLLRGEIPHYEIEKRYRTKSGEQRWGQLTVTLLHHSEEGEPLVLRMVEDITQRKFAEQAQAEHWALADALQDLIAALNSTLEPEEVLDRLLAQVGRVVPYDGATILLIEDDQARVVRSAGQLNQYQDDIVGRTLDISIENVRLPLITNKALVLSSTADEPSWLSLPDLEWIESHLKIPIQVEGQVIGFLSLDSATPGFYQQIHADRLQTFADHAALAIRNAQLFDTVRRYASELEQRVEARTAELAHERAQLRAILDGMGEGVLFLDSARRIRYVNRAFAHLSGFSVEETLAIPETVWQHMMAASDEAPDVWNKRVQATLRTGRTWRGETRIQRRDGSQFDAGITVTGVIDDGQIAGQIYLIRDISSDKALQEQKDRFIANASHELRTPLTNIKMRLYLIRKRPLQAPEHLHVMEQVAGRMEVLIDDLLDISRFERGVIALERTQVVLQALIEQVVAIQRPHAEEKPISLALDFPPEKLVVLADPKRMIQVVTNLLTNAINYTPPGGAITVRLRRVDRLQNQPEPTGDYALIQVQDSGVGIEPEALSAIFEPFFRAPDSMAKGSGLGLTITREIVELHGGAIWVESDVDQGSTFSVALRLITPH